MTKSVYAARPPGCPAIADHCGKCKARPCHMPNGPALDPDRDYDPPAEGTYEARLAFAYKFRSWPKMHPACQSIARAAIATRKGTPC